MRNLTAFISGATFAAGLAYSGMIQPSKVIGFLDITGAWDPTLAFVMGGALAIFMPGYRYVTQRQRPLVEPVFDLPTAKAITMPLVVGSIIFGLGWGLCGLCPAAAIAALPAGSSSAIAVTVGMALGIVGMRAVRQALAKQPAVEEPVSYADF